MLIHSFNTFTTEPRQVLEQFFMVFHNNKASILGEVVDDEWMSGTGL